MTRWRQQDQPARRRADGKKTSCSRRHIIAAKAATRCSRREEGQRNGQHRGRNQRSATKSHSTERQENRDPQLNEGTSYARYTWNQLRRCDLEQGSATKRTDEHETEDQEHFSAPN